jgi:hypothetical protein
MSTPLEELALTVPRRGARISLPWPPPCRRRSAPITAQLAALAQRPPLALAGAAATPETVAAIGARLLNGDPVTAAESGGWPR